MTGFHVVLGRVLVKELSVCLKKIMKEYEGWNRNYLPMLILSLDMR